jgi:hypothetical protein
MRQVERSGTLHSIRRQNAFGLLPTWTFHAELYLQARLTDAVRSNLRPCCRHSRMKPQSVAACPGRLDIHMLIAAG